MAIDPGFADALKAFTTAAAVLGTGFALSAFFDRYVMSRTRKIVLRAHSGLKTVVEVRRGAPQSEIDAAVVGAARLMDGPDLASFEGTVNSDPDTVHASEAPAISPVKVEIIHRRNSNASI